jgi:hypothetical protein
MSNSRKVRLIELDKTPQPRSNRKTVHARPGSLDKKLERREKSHSTDKKVVKQFRPSTVREVKQTAPVEVKQTAPVEVKLPQPVPKKQESRSLKLRNERKFRLNSTQAIVLNKRLSP